MGKTKHGRGEQKHGVYSIWLGMRQRCYDKNCKDYQYYGAKGIGICQGWSEFLSFLADVGEMPSHLHSIDRVDNDGGYWCGHCEECVANGWPKNVRWATREEQSNNRSNNIFMEFGGLCLTLTQWARKAGLNKGTLHSRIFRQGWPLSKALTQPIRQSKGSI